MALILASASPIRRHMLMHAGADPAVVPADIDEDAVKASQPDGAVAAEALARAKAEAVSRLHPDQWVIGSDSIVEVGGRRFSKPETRAAAAEHLAFFSGRLMRLVSAVALAQNGKSDWAVTDCAELDMRTLSEPFIEAYLDAEWPAVGNCVGVFRMEGRGVQLFSAVRGSHFTILGMPLLPLLGALRDRGLLMS